jgi:hypothetical protein
MALSIRFATSDILAAVLDRLRGDLRQVERFPAFHPALAAGQGEHRLDEAFLLIAEHQQFLAG